MIACQYDGGVIVGTDTRTSSGALVVCRTSDKITQVSRYIGVLRSGSSADTQAITDIVKYHINFYEMERGERITVHAAAQIFRDISYRYRDDLTAGLIVCGWDRQKGAQIYSIPIGGMILQQSWTVGGSGSMYVYGYLDSNYKSGMSQEECISFVKKAVAHAINRDASSGGCVRIAVINSSGIRRQLFLGDQVPSMLKH
ncbi:proteasome (prosome, macropain) subunit, beta [Trichuris trichiura]|uniref:proteasome endopeptidase complex n=1 Tax=Trichuris trichiura TaxID=36087 RepID=A0A077Z059_TRITR|nr:proteasome (prosome, macropain) subunit, beta [Trichuris trichiura]